MKGNVPTRPSVRLCMDVLRFQFQTAAWPSVTTPLRALVQPKRHIKKDLFTRPQPTAQTDRVPGASRAGTRAPSPPLQPHSAGFGEGRDDQGRGQDAPDMQDAQPRTLTRPRPLPLCSSPCPCSPSTQLRVPRPGLASPTPPHRAHPRF